MGGKNENKRDASPPESVSIQYEQRNVHALTTLRIVINWSGYVEEQAFS